MLFLDELGEFPPSLLDALRQPIEEGEVRVARRGASVRFPGAAQVVAATNPCPCGYSGDRRRACRCTPTGVERYRRRLSGPLLDRFDLRVAVGALDADALVGPRQEGSSVVRQRVAAARRVQSTRGALNRDMPRAALDAQPWDAGARWLLRQAVGALDVTGRGWDRVRRVARTVADLAAADVVAEQHVAEALAYRGEP